MKIKLTKPSLKTVAIAVTVLLLFKFVYSSYTNSIGRDLRPENTDLYLKSITDDKAKNASLPNIVLFLADDLGYGDISSFGSKLIHTPNIDNIASSGVKMTNYYAPGPICSPSRAGMLTGRYPQRAHVPGVLFDSGSMLQNIRKFLGILSYGMEGLSPDEATLPEILQAKGYRTAAFGKWHLGTTGEFHPSTMGFEDSYLPDYKKDQATLTQRLTDKSVDFITKNKNESFFLYYATPVPHEPLFRVEEYAEKTQGGMYGEMIQEMDASIGTIVNKLDELNIADNTLVIFTSDNGPFRMGTAGQFRGGKGLSTTGGYRVPFVAKWPNRIPAGLETDEMAMGIDLLPTILSAINVELPNDRKIDGQDILPLLTIENAKTPHDYLYLVNHKTVESVIDSEGFKYQIKGKPDNSKWWYLDVGPYLFNTNLDPSESYSILETNTEKAAQLADKITALQAEFDGNLRGWK